MDMVHEREVSGEEEAMGDDLRRGPWTVEEDLLLVNYIAAHGEGRWNSLARCAGLKRTGKSCRLRWLNYLRPDLRRGNITPEEQLLILELHSRWGNRWSKIAQHLPGRTDNEIKNYWRTRVQKHAKQLKCDVNSQQFKDVMRYLWMPRLVERIHASSGTVPTAAADPSSWHTVDCGGGGVQMAPDWPIECPGQVINPSPEMSSTAGSSSTSADSAGMQFWSPPVTESLPSYHERVMHNGTEPNIGHDLTQPSQFGETWSESLSSLGGYRDLGLPDYEIGNLGENIWSVDDLWYTQGL